MPTVREIVTEVSKYLVDQEPDFEFEHWSDDEVLTYLRDAVNIVSMNLKSQFTRTSEMTLVPGTVQRLPEGCAQFVSVMGMVNRDGSLSFMARRTSNRNLGLLSRKPCAPGRGETYRVTEYQVDTSDQRTFYVQPPVPPGANVRVAISCYSPPLITSMDDAFDVPFHLIPIIKEFMLYYAYGVDTESVTVRDYTDRHWRNGTTLLAAEKVNNPVNAIDVIGEQK